MLSATLGLIELTTPAMLGGLALLALPIVAHLLNRRARRPVVFPSLVLLRASVASQSRLFRLRRWLLLLLRCLAVAMIALAFARPVWLDAGTKRSGVNKADGVVLVLDASASTRQRTGGVTAIQELRAAGVRALDSLRTGTDVANIVLASARPRPVFPKLSPNLPALREELGRVEGTYERADLLPAVALAGQLLAKHDGKRRIVILSDLQQTNWQEVVAGGRAAPLLPSETQVTVIGVDTPAPDNIGLSSPRHFPAQPLVGQPTQLAVQVSSFAQFATKVRLDVKVDDQPPQSETLTLLPHEQREVAVSAVLQGTRDHEVTFSIPEDGLAADNRAFLVVKARRRLPVAIVSDDDPNQPGTAAYYLTRALAPHADGQVDRFEPRHVSSRQLTDAALADVGAVFVGYLAELDPAAAETLVKFVRGGGGMLFFCGEGAVGPNLQRLQDAAGSVALLPWRPGPIRVLAEADQGLTITAGKWQSPLLREFDEQSQIVFSQIRFARVWTAGAPAPEATILLTYSDGTPALGSRPVEAGQFLLANFSPAIEASDLGKYGSFVALVQSLAQQLRPTAEGAGREPVAGEPYQHPQPFRLGADLGKLTVIGPASQSVPLTATVNAGEATVQLQQTSLPGFYRFRMGEKTLASAAVNVDKRESNLERIDRESLLRCFEVGGGRLTVQGAGGFDPLPNTRGRPLWGWCLAVTMAAFGIELFCLGYWKR